MLLWLYFAVGSLFFCVHYILLRLVITPILYFNITKFALESGFWLRWKHLERLLNPNLISRYTLTGEQPSALAINLNSWGNSNHTYLRAFPTYHPSFLSQCWLVGNSLKTVSTLMVVVNWLLHNVCLSVFLKWLRKLNHGEFSNGWEKWITENCLNARQLAAHGELWRCCWWSGKWGAARPGLKTKSHHRGIATSLGAVRYF